MMASCANPSPQQVARALQLRYRGNNSGLPFFTDLAGKPGLTILEHLIGRLQAHHGGHGLEEGAEQSAPVVLDEFNVVVEEAIDLRRETRRGNSLPRKPIPRDFQRGGLAHEARAEQKKKKRKRPGGERVLYSIINWFKGAFAADTIRGARLGLPWQGRRRS